MAAASRPEMILSFINGTSAEERCRALLSIYREIDAETGAFAAACGVACPDGCGRCCEGFDPPVTRTEADLIGLFLLDVSRECPARMVTAAPQCPFHAAQSPLHCDIYPVRPLLCRAFGYSSIGGRDGFQRFSFCKYMPTELHRCLDEEAMKRYFSLLPPRVEDHGRILFALSHESVEEQLRLSGAISVALDRMRALKAYVRATL